MVAETFAARLRRLREATTVTVLRHNALWQRSREVTVPLSGNELASRADLDPSAVARLEAGTWEPRRGTVLHLAAALELDAVETDLLLIAAGFCPLALAELPEDGQRFVMEGLVNDGR